jgi:hypothetical protein
VTWVTGLLATESTRLASHQLPYFKAIARREECVAPYKPASVVREQAITPSVAFGNTRVSRMNYHASRRFGQSERGMINSWGVLSGAEAALGDARRATDNAIRTMFELAQKLELLREAIEHAKTGGPFPLPESCWSSDSGLAGEMVESCRPQFDAQS